MPFDLESAHTESGLTPTYGQVLSLGKSLYPVGVKVKGHTISVHIGFIPTHPCCALQHTSQLLTVSLHPACTVPIPSSSLQILWLITEKTSL